MESTTSLLETGDASLKRPRPVLSCLECRRKKLKCDRLLPCQQCQKSGRATLCAFSSGADPEPRGNDSDDGSRAIKRARRKSAVEGGATREFERDPELQPATSRKSGLLEDLQDRVARLEEVAGLPRRSPPPPTANGNDSDLPSRGFYTNGAAQSTPISASRYHARKERMTLLSQARWLLSFSKRQFHLAVLLFTIKFPWLTKAVAQFDEARKFMYKVQNRGEYPEIELIAHDLYAVHNAIKVPKVESRQHNIDLTTLCKNMIELVPSQAICDKLVALYFDNFENCQRILHRPSFEEDCRMFWESWRRLGHTALTSFVPTLLAVLSVASSLNIIPECGKVTLDGQNSLPTALELIQIWLDNLPFKQKYSMATLRLRLLILIPQRSRSSRIEDLWNLSGQNVRYAMSMGLHKGSGVGDSIFEAEQRLRLWAAIVEGDLTMSLMCGMPTMISSSDFSSSLPANVNDSELFEEMSELPKSRPTSEWTDSLCQHVLANTLTQRLDAYRYMSNSKHDIEYDKVLKYTRGLERILKELPAPLRFDHAPEDGSSKPERLFARMIFDTFVRRVLLNLYTPFALAITTNDTFKEARVAYLQSCLVLLCYQDLFDPKFSELEIPQQEGYWDTFYKVYKYDVIQTCLGLCLEIKRMATTPTLPSARIVGISGASPTGGTPNALLGKLQPWSKATLIKAVEDSIEPMVRRIARPGGDAKDLLCLEVVLHSVRTNQSPSQKEELIMEGVTELLLACQRQLRKDGVAIPGTALTPSSGSIDGLFDGLAGLADFTNFDLTTTTLPNMSYPNMMQYANPAEWNYA